MRAVLREKTEMAVSQNSENARLHNLMKLFLGRFGHDVTGNGGKSGALELDGSVVDVKFLRGFFLNGALELFAFVHVHVGNASVET